MAALEQILSHLKKWSSQYSNSLERLNQSRINMIADAFTPAKPGQHKVSEQFKSMHETQMHQYLIHLNQTREPDTLPTSYTATYDPSGDNAMNDSAQVVQLNNLHSEQLNHYGEIFKVVKNEVKRPYSIAETEHQLSEIFHELSIFERNRALQGLQNIREQRQTVPGLGTSPQAALSYVWAYINKQPREDVKNTSKVRLSKMLIDIHSEEMSAKSCVQQLLEVLNHNQSDLQHLFKA